MDHAISLHRILPPVSLLPLKSRTVRVSITYECKFPISHQICRVEMHAVRPEYDSASGVVLVVYQYIKLGRLCHE